MTDEELDYCETWLVQCAISKADADRIRAVFETARRGLRADEEVCGRCEDWVEAAEDDDEDHNECQDGCMLDPGPGDFCSRWRAKEGG